MIISQWFVYESEHMIVTQHLLCASHWTRYWGYKWSPAGSGLCLLHAQTWMHHTRSCPYLPKVFKTQLKRHYLKTSLIVPVYRNLCPLWKLVALRSSLKTLDVHHIYLLCTYFISFTTLWVPTRESLYLTYFHILLPAVDSRVSYRSKVVIETQACSTTERSSQQTTRSC